MISEHHISVARTARYYTLGPRDRGVSEVWIVVHGYGQLAGRFLSNFTQLDDGHRLIVAPEALSRFYLDQVRGSHVASPVGATWMTREDRISEIEDHIRYLDTLVAQVLTGIGRDHVRLVVLGFSQGVATVCRWLERGTTRADALILWGSPMPHDVVLASAAHPLRTLRLTIVSGIEDELVTPDAMAEQDGLLRSHGIDFERRTFAGGHRLDDALLAELAGTSAPARRT